MAKKVRKHVKDVVGAQKTKSRKIKRRRTSTETVVDSEKSTADAIDVQSSQRNFSREEEEVETEIDPPLQPKTKRHKKRTPNGEFSEPVQVAVPARQQLSEMQNQSTAPTEVAQPQTPGRVKRRQKGRNVKTSKEVRVKKSLTHTNLRPDSSSKHNHGVTSTLGAMTCSDVGFNTGVSFSSPSWEFPVDSSDHCESPFVAYEDLHCVLEQLAKSLGKSKDLLRIYDPYYCTGRMKEHLLKLGFPLVHNQNEDFYGVVDTNATPTFDVLVTNPPYTANAPARSNRDSIFWGTRDHVERLLTFCSKVDRPCCLLMPNHYYMKPYFKTIVAGLRFAFLAPSRRYEYEAPRLLEGDRARGNVLDAHGKARNKKTRRTAPFVSFWYLLGSRSDGGAWWEPARRKVSGSVGLYDLRTLPHEVRDAADPWRRKLKPWERKGPSLSRNGDKLCKQCGQVHGLCKHTRDS
eukprot:TRINITY_DN39365_c0_g1_i1.p1 TRINITY_DN39365_c0_g1~~TRINITY_DN39365_c0_g1_i1.p1  ORF type:complete len:461 (-),score=48.94 TRINITY_DN39365_c0_g1_i1:105-1487(-)